MELEDFSVSPEEAAQLRVTKARSSKRWDLGLATAKTTPPPPSAPAPPPVVATAKPKPRAKPVRVLSDEPRLRELQQAHIGNDSLLPYEHLNQLVGLPPWVRLTPTGKNNSAKESFLKGWNHFGGPSFSALELLGKNGHIRKTAIGAGALTGPQGEGLLMVDFDDPVDDALRGYSIKAFIEAFDRDPADLPLTAEIESGKPGRFKSLLRVPEECWADLGNWSLATGRYGPKNDQFALEVIWQNSTGNCRHGVVVGDHPEASEEKPWAYKWREGRSPAEVGIADAPAWFLTRLAVLRAKELMPRTTPETVVVDGAAGEGEPQPFDLLSGKQQIALITEASAHLPVRDRNTPGNYPELRKALCGLTDYWGLEAAISLLVDTEWNSKNDWSYKNLGSLEDWMTDLHEHPTDEDRKARIGSFLYVAQDNGWEYPDWAKPPRDHLGSYLMTAANSVKSLEKGLAEIEHLERASQRRMALKALQKDLGLSHKDFIALISDLLAEQSEENTKYNNFQAVMDADDSNRVVIQRLVAAGVVSMVAAEGGCGKSSFVYQMAEAVTTGKPFLGQLEVQQGNVLIIQADESRHNAKAKWTRMGADFEQDRLHLKWAWSPGQMLDLEREIVEKQISLVVMDSFGKLFGGDGNSMNDAEIGLHMYSLNAIASRTGAAVVVTHHLKKTEKGRVDKNGNPVPVTLSDFFGSSYIVNGLADAWGMWRTGEQIDGQPLFALRYLKDRGMLMERGWTMHLEGSDESLRFWLSQHGGGLAEMEVLDNLQSTLLALLKKDAGVWFMADELCPLVAELTRKSNNRADRSVRRVLADLHSDAATTGVERRAVAVGGRGRRPYEYRYAR